MEYISKIKLMSHIVRNYRAQGDKYNAAQILFDIEALPEEDVIPVKRGKWVADYNGFEDGFPPENSWSCSVCGMRKWGKLTWKYCPRCGSKMEVEDETDGCQNG